MGFAQRPALVRFDEAGRWAPRRVVRQAGRSLPLHLPAGVGERGEGARRGERRREEDRERRKEERQGEERGERREGTEEDRGRREGRERERGQRRDKRVQSELPLAAVPCQHSRHEARARPL